MAGEFRRRKMRSIASTVCSISAAVVSLPNEKRMAEAARSGDRPIASRTCEATTEPTMQAEPLEAQTPSRSSAISIVSEAKPGKADVERVGKARRRRRRSVAPRGKRARSRATIRSRSFASRSCSLGKSRRTSSAAAAIPTIAGTFSVPGRRSLSWAPPNWIAFDRNPGAQIKKAGAFWSVKFVRGETGGVDPGQVGRHLAERLHHVAVQQDAALAADARRSPPSAG